MSWVFVLIAGAVVVVIALVAVGRETFTTRERPRLALFDLDEAVDFVADHLSFEVTAKLSFDDVRTLLGWHLERLGQAGVSGERSPPPIADVVVVDDEKAVPFLLARCRQSDLDADAHDVAAVLAAQRAYLEAIGAIGPQAQEGTG
ncbi:MAG: hypothetical protein ACRD0U_20665 [Acidimicrobiales bacterium]